MHWDIRDGARIRPIEQMIIDSPKRIVNHGQCCVHKDESVAGEYRYGIRRNIEKLSVLSNGMYVISIARQHEYDVANESEQGDL
jgi:hypothetical protein